MKKGFIKTEDKSYQLQKLAEQRKMATVSPTGRPLFEQRERSDDAAFLSSRANFPEQKWGEKKARTWFRSINIVELMKQETQPTRNTLQLS